AAAALALVVAVLPFVGLGGSADGSAHRHCIGEGCGVCELASMIYSLPADTSEITLENAAQVLDTLHAIDRAKYDAFLPYEANEDVFDAVYEDFAALCGGVVPSGEHAGTPVRYLDVLNKIESLGSVNFFPIKDNRLDEGQQLAVWNSNAVFKIERLDGDMEPIVVTLAGDSLTGSTAYMNANSPLAPTYTDTGWQFKYPLPVGRYSITEIDSHTETTTGEIVSTTASYSLDGTHYEAGNSVEFEIKPDENTSVSFLNHFSGGILTINAVDDEGNTSNLPGSVKVKVTVTDDGDAPVADTPFNDGAYETDENGVMEITLDSNNGYSVALTLTDPRHFCSVALAEEPSGYTYEFASDDGSGNPSASASNLGQGFTATYTFTPIPTGDLEIAIAGEDGDANNIPESVDVTVKLTDGEGNPVNETFGDVEFIAGEATLTMGRNTSSLTITGIPFMSFYEIISPTQQEFNESGTGYVLTGRTNYEGILTQDATATLTFARSAHSYSISFYDTEDCDIDAVAELSPSVTPDGDGKYALAWGTEYTVTVPDGCEAEEPIKFTLTADGSLEDTSSSAVVHEDGTTALWITVERKTYSVYFVAEDTEGIAFNGVVAELVSEGFGSLAGTDADAGGILYSDMAWNEDYELRVQAFDNIYYGYKIGDAASPYDFVSVSFRLNADGSVMIDGESSSPEIEFDAQTRSFSVEVTRLTDDDMLKFEVTFDADGGSPVPPKQIVKAYGHATEPTPPEKSGYTFKHWADESGNPFNFERQILGSCALKAVWEKDEDRSENNDRPSGGGGGGGGAPLKDTDGDGIPDILDEDDDNDGLLDFEDPNPLVPDTIVDLGADKFTDVDPDSWYYEYVDYVVKNGIMEGISDTLFNPNGTASRAEIITTLWRIEGSPLVSHPLYFSDVSDGLWYIDALRWTNSENIVIGYDDGRFGTDDPVTREQIATILWRYARFKGVDTSSGENTSLLKFSDAKKISAYAISALQWACGEEIIEGTVDKTGAILLDPQGSATRAQIAAILMRFCENIL
ncbi:MAG: S-layer homology domain-containing protein, partial [Oscillospiraceae bacterium]|nr:S-layer homology domain-containing protein [Oscillospiraceae bacterium]